MVALVDWDLAGRYAVRLAPRGPSVSPEEANAVVDALRELAGQARGPVAEITGLLAAPERSPAVVVDRPEWIRSNLAAFQVAIEPLVAARAGKDGISVLDAVGSRVTALELAGALAWLSGRVLGQFEVITPPGQPGRLMLVAPNILAAEAELDVVPRDFRLWVCLHEETHRAQFGGVQWLADHFLAEVNAFVSASDLPSSELLERALAAVRTLASAARGRPGPSIIEAVQTPAQREIFDRLTGLMSLLEGHADHVMDAVGPELIPTVTSIRERFDNRRKRAGTVDGFVRSVLGMNTKLKQYSQGAQFVRSVLTTEGHEGFSQVWAEPANLPSASEIEDPAAWMRRVLA